MRKSNYQILKEIVDDYTAKMEYLNKKRMTCAQNEVNICLEEMFAHEQFNKKVSRCHNTYENTQREQPLGALDEEKKKTQRLPDSNPVGSSWHKNNTITRPRDVDAHIAKDT